MTLGQSEVRSCPLVIREEGGCVGVLVGGSPAQGLPGSQSTNRGLHCCHWCPPAFPGVPGGPLDTSVSPLCGCPAHACWGTPSLSTSLWYSSGGCLSPLWSPMPQALVLPLHSSLTAFGPRSRCSEGLGRGKATPGHRAWPQLRAGNPPYLEQQEGCDDVVGHVEVVPDAGLVEWEPFQGEGQLQRGEERWEGAEAGKAPVPPQPHRPLGSSLPGPREAPGGRTHRWGHGVPEQAHSLSWVTGCI